MSDEPQLGLAQGDDGASRLLALATLANELGSEHVANEASELAARLAEGRFFVACVGQFKRGKSTLIGALIGESILPTGFVPVTAVPTVIRFGSAKRARIRFTRRHLAGNRLAGAGTVRLRGAQPGEHQRGRGSRGVCAQPAACRRDVPGGHARSRIGLLRQHGDHAGVSFLTSTLRSW